MIILARAEIGMKIQERMYESSELTTEGTVCEINKELAYEWGCCGWIKYAKLLYPRVWMYYSCRTCLQYKDEYSSTKNANMPQTQFTSSFST